MQDLTDRVAFVTGGTSGIGLGIAQALLAAGAKVALAYRREHHLRDALHALHQHRGSIHTVQVDVADREAMAHAAREVQRTFGKVHILCNNAGIGIRTSVGESSYNDWDWAISVNVMGIVNGVREFLPLIRAHGEGGHIVTTASIIGLLVPPVSGVYATTKAASIAMMESLRGELAPERIGVSVYCPGLVCTNILETEDSRPPQYAEAGRALDAKSRETIKQDVIAFGMSPIEAGQHVLNGIRRNQLYILSHPEFGLGLRERFDAILRSLPADASVPPQRIRAESRTLTNPIYRESTVPFR